MLLKSRDNNRQAVTIKHGTDPEVQEVDFASRYELPKSPDDQLNKFNTQPPLTSLRKRKKSTTTKSTMTNEDDYTTAHTTTPCTTPASSMHGDHDIDDTNDVIEVGHKMVGWKMTPRVHFPPPNTINASSSSIRRILPVDDSHDFLKSNEIDPPFIHRPDRTLLVHQTKPASLLQADPVQAWPGYGGNVYFRPFQIVNKPIRERILHSPTSNYSGKISRIANSRLTMASSTIPDNNTLSRDSRSTSRAKSSQRFHPGTYSKNDISEFSECFKQNSIRQTSHLNKTYISGIRGNVNSKEDISRIIGRESLGSLRIGDPTKFVHRQSTKETYTRHTVVEKVPRNFVFHQTETSPPKLKLNSISVRNYCRNYGIPEWVLKQYTEKYCQNQFISTHFPSILRVKGQKVEADSHGSESHEQANLTSTNTHLYDINNLMTT